MSSSKVSGFLSESIDPQLQKHLFLPQILRELASGIRDLSDVNKAHVVMLQDRTILSSEVASTLVRAILALEVEGAAGVPADPAREVEYGCGRLRVPANGQRSRFPEDHAGGRGRSGFHSNPGPLVQHGIERRLSLEPREVDPHARVRALGEGKV